MPALPSFTDTFPAVPGQNPMSGMPDAGMGFAPDNPMAMAQQPEPSTEELEARRKALEFYTTQLKRMRYFRRQYDLRFAEFYREYLGQRDDRFYPDNVTRRSNTFVPYPFSNVEAITGRVMDALFSPDPWFEVDSTPTYSSDEAAEKMQTALVDRLHKANFFDCFESVLKTILIYGTGGMKLDWDRGVDTVIYKQPIPAMAPAMDPTTGMPQVNPQTGQPVMQPVIDPQTGQPVIQGYQPAVKQIPRNCPKFIPIDVYDLLIDPDKAYVAHLTERTWRQIRTEAAADPNLYFPEAIEELRARLASEEDADEVLIRLAEFWNSNDNTWAILTFGEDPEGISFKDLRASFRAASYSPYKRRVYGGQTILLWRGDNPFMHKRCPIVFSGYIKIPQELFALGAIEIITDLSDALNRFVNMIADNWNLGINHRYAYDVNAEIDHEALNSFNVPGGKVGVVGNPQEVILPLPFFTPAAGDYQILELYRGMMEMASGVSDFYNKGVGSPTNNKTGTGIVSVINESSFRIKDFIRNLEIDVLQPVLEMCASMIQQFSTEPFIVQAGDVPPGQPSQIQVNPQDLIGSYAFRIVAANYMTPKVVRQRNMMALANVISQSPFVDQHEALKELLKVFEIKNINRLLKSEQQVQMEQQQQMQQQLQMMVFENQLDTEKKMRLSQAKAQHAAAGRPAKAQFEGKIPGHGQSSLIRELAQGLGANAMGLEGMEEIPQ